MMDIQLVKQFIETESWEGARALAQAHPELATPEVISELQRWEEAARTFRPTLGFSVRVHWRYLQWAQSEGLDAAWERLTQFLAIVGSAQPDLLRLSFAEQSGMVSEWLLSASPQEQRQFGRLHPVAAELLVSRFFALAEQSERDETRAALLRVATTIQGGIHDQHQSSS